MKTCILKYVAILANIGVLVFTAILFFETHSHERYLALLLALPPVLSLLAICTGPDREERTLQKQVRKAALRKELKDLAEFAEEKR